MANYYSVARTNYFRVKDELSFRAWAERFKLEIIEDGNGLYGLLPGETDGGEFFLFDHTTDEVFDICDEIADHLTDDSVAVVMETGAEKLRYLVGWAVAINSKGERVTVTLNDIYAKATEHFGIEPTRAEY